MVGFWLLHASLFLNTEYLLAHNDPCEPASRFLGILWPISFMTFSEEQVQK